MKKVCVMGGGTMGGEMAQVFASAGLEVIVKGRSEASLQKTKDKIEKNLSKLLAKGKITEESKGQTVSLLTYTTDFAPVADCDLVVEAVVEDLEVKKELFKQLDELCKPETILATNTSAISITAIAADISRPDKFIGMHFFNPASMMKLVEIIRGLGTSDETYNAVEEITKKIGKEPVEVKEAPGFVVNKILIPMINEAIGLLEQGVASAENIDKAMMLGANHPLGPLALSDLIGNDVVLHIMQHLLDETGDSKYRPAGLLRKMVRGGLLGRKSGKGFYEYGKK